MHKKFIHNVLTGLGMLVVLLFGWWGWYVLNGSNAAEARAVRVATEYVQKNYPDIAFEVGDVYYWTLYDHHYNVNIVSDMSIDTQFVIRVARSGRIVEDTYEADVASHRTTYDRIIHTYQTEMNKMISNSPVQHSLLSFDASIPSDDIGPGLPLASLSLDQSVDLERIGAAYGVLSLDINDRVTTYKELVTLLRDLKAESTAEGVPFHTVDVRFRIEGTSYLAEGVTRKMMDTEAFQTQIEQLAVVD